MSNHKAGFEKETLRIYNMETQQWRNSVETNTLPVMERVEKGGQIRWADAEEKAVPKKEELGL